MASPQFIVALKLAGVAAALLSVKVATVALKGLPATALKLTGVAVITGSVGGGDRHYCDNAQNGYYADP